MGRKDKAFGKRETPGSWRLQKNYEYFGNRDERGQGNQDNLHLSVLDELDLIAAMNRLLGGSPPAHSHLEAHEGIAVTDRILPAL